MAEDASQVVESIVSIPFSGRSTNIDAGPSPDAASMLPLGEFLLGPENRQVEVVLHWILEGGEGCKHPIVLFGRSGSGKSHFAIGLVNYWKNHFRQWPAVYVAAVDFARELNDAIETRTVEDFQLRTRKASLLVLDDLHLLAGKHTPQRELIYLLDAYPESGARVVMTSAVAPEQLTGFLPALHTRLLAGLAAPLLLPAVETRRAILGRLAKSRSLRLDDDALAALAEGLPIAVSGLTGVLAQLQIAAQADSSPITLEAVRQFLATRNAAPAPSLGDIAAVTARHFALKVADLRSPCRRRAVVTARDVAMYLARTLTRKSLKQIGAYFAGRDHTTVSHGCCKTEQLLESDPAIRIAVEQLRGRLQPATV